MDNYLEINYENNMKALSEAIECCEQEYSHAQILEILKSDDDIKKQLALIELKNLNSQEEADILIWNLTGKSGPIRETTAYKISDLIKNSDFSKYFQSNKTIDTIVKSITDINPSVSRYSLEIIKYIDNTDYLYNKILEEINKTLDTIDKEAKNRSYVQNKKNFNLYWNLEALNNIADKISAGNELIEILKITANSNDYTIREKTAKCAAAFADKNSNFKQITDNIQTIRCN